MKSLKKQDFCADPFSDILTQHTMGDWRQTLNEMSDSILTRVWTNVWAGVFRYDLSRVVVTDKSNFESGLFSDGVIAKLLR